MKVDKLDKKILYFLEENSKTPLSKLSKLVGASREVVNYRIKKLEESGIIKSYITRIKQSIFSSGAATLNLKIKRTNQERYDDILNYFQNHKNINWFGELCGNYDLTLTILFQNPNDLGRITNEILFFLDSELISHNISLFTQEIKFSRSGILNVQEKKMELKESLIFDNKDKLKLDSKDLIILQELSINSRIKNIELAKKTNLGEDIIRIRIKNLEKKEVILGYTIVIDVTKFNLEGYYIFLQLENYDVNFTKEYLKSSNYIYFSAFMTGKYNLLLGIYSKNRQHFNELLIDLRKKLGKSIKDYSFEMLLKEHKEQFVTKELIV